MRTLINYLRSCFCKHDWEFLTKTNIYEKETAKMPYKSCWVYRCKKCGCRNIVKSR